jgi:hypothetical protein
MKPKPAPSMQRATSAGPRSMRAPSASSTSAEPDRLVAERLPCLASAQPAPAAMSAAVVETLKVLRPPPVPAVSTRSLRAQGTAAAIARIVAASPASSSTVSPFVRSAMRKPAICVSETSPDMISARTAEVSSWGRSLPDATASIARVRVSLGNRQPRKFASSCLPSSVRTDSGWNWTPSAGRSRWRRPMITPPPLADTSKQSGTSSSTTSEW